MRKTAVLSPNYSKKTRKKSQIKFIIIHYTGMQSEIESLDRLKNPKSKVSCHYLINRAGKLIQMIEDQKIAWHAGKSRWKNIKDLNDNSIGIELVNKGHKFGYQKFTISQINKLIRLCKKLKKKYKIRKNNVLGHSDIAPLRKKDPGEKFPWGKLSNFDLGKWYTEKKISDLKYPKFKNQKKNEFKFFQNLHKVGYRYFALNKRIASDKLVVKAFQRRYLPKNVTGKIDEKTYKISHFLAS